MIESVENVPTVPIQQLAEFANSLFGFLYLHFDVHHQIVRQSDHFKEIIGRAVLHIERNSCKFNNQVLDRCCFEVDRSILCQKICAAYPGFDYFKKLYYSSAFILDLMLWWNRHTETVDLSVGPSLWIEVFQKNFDSVFEDEGGWNGLAEAGKFLLDCANEDGSILPRDALLPNYFMAVMSGLESLIPKCDETADINMYEIRDSVMSLKSAPIKAIGALEMEKAEIEETGGNPPEKVDEDPDLPPPISVEGQLGEREGRKRRHDADPSDSEADLDHSPSKPKRDRKDSKRESDTTG